MERDWSKILTSHRIPNFNSHAHVERDVMATVPTADVRISTHTLTWSVTRAKGQLVISSTNFNSHAHVERDYGNMA